MIKNTDLEGTTDINENTSLVGKKNGASTVVERLTSTYASKLNQRPFAVEMICLYLWMSTDLCWTQLWYWPSLILGSVTLLWMFCTFYIVWIENDLNEFFVLVAQFLWIFANVWWMMGEMHDYEYPEQEKLTVKRAQETSLIMLMALLWLGLYYFFLRPMRLISANIVRDIENNSQRPRLSVFFRTWRDYETIHVFLWLGKDYAWCSENLIMWYIFMVPTVLVAADFAWTSLWTKKASLIEKVNSCAVLLWVIANMVWAIGDFYYPKTMNDPAHFYDYDGKSSHSLRWYVGWILLVTMSLILLTYVVILRPWVDAICSRKSPI